ncbi:MAG: 6-bladed beta-propeller, partial [Acidobacteria bacterium]|nr:6-bladed beta-propeller [Acidobacteriota bacterium]
GVDNDRVQVFSAAGKFLGQFGEEGNAPGRFDRPIEVAVSPDGTIYVVDFGNDRIQVFRQQED